LPLKKGEFLIDAIDLSLSKDAITRLIVREIKNIEKSQSRKFAHIISVCVSH